MRPFRVAFFHLLFSLFLLTDNYDHDSDHCANGYNADQHKQNDLGAAALIVVGVVNRGCGCGLVLGGY